MGGLTIAIKESTIDQLQTVLARLKVNNGGVDDDNYWATWVPDLKPDEPGFSFTEGRWLRELKALDEAMGVLHEGVGEALRILDQKRVKASVATKSSKSSIPNEVLSRIFETGYDCAIWDNEFSRLVSHVSRRFRMVALDTPFIWSVVHNAQGAEEIDTFLTRSRNAKLTICINEHFGTPLHLSPKLSIVQFLRQVGKPGILRRWHEFRCFLENKEDLTAMRQVLGKRCDFPFLRSITLAKKILSDCPSSADACKLWRTPVLRHFTGIDMVLPNKTRLATLNSAVLDLQTSQALSSEDITKVLNAISMVEVLTIRAISSAYYQHASPPAKPVNLAGLTSMTVLPEIVSYALFATSPPIFKWFTAHNLTKVTISSGTSGCDSAIDMTFHGDNAYPLLRELSVICTSYTGFRNDVFPTALAKIPSLQTLSIIGSPNSIAHLTMLWQKGFRFPPLHTLRLHYCSGINDAAIRDVVAELRRGPQWSEFQTLELFHCSTLSGEYLKRLKKNLGDKLHYIPARSFWG
ncbi:hypothetical protein BD410DRAFT_898782 [Rickenella mellea]|uniref:Uncharacterized protein n=1 Tax=Rickenella mellea TaxID=50990 RepID=A0A4Y7Q4F9_9AGAM|nr:hypothetical protein BD410DRAFT_898782 [Rickenella mellea]